MLENLGKLFWIFGKFVVQRFSIVTYCTYIHRVRNSAWLVQTYRRRIWYTRKLPQWHSLFDWLQDEYISMYERSRNSCHLYSQTVFRSSIIKYQLAHDTVLRLKFNTVFQIPLDGLITLNFLISSVGDKKKISSAQINFSAY